MGKLENMKIIANRQKMLANNRRAAYQSGPYSDPNNQTYKQTDTARPLQSTTQKKISVVIYSIDINSDELINCVSSIKKQTIRNNNIEIIIVTKNTIEIDDTNIKIVDCQQNYIDNALMNSILEIASGQYITFINGHSDYASTSIFEDLYNIMEKEKGEVLVSICDKCIDIEKYYGVYSCEDIRNTHMLFSDYHTLSTCMMNLDFIKTNNIQFIDTPIAIDQLFYIKSVIQANNIILYKEPICSSCANHDPFLQIYDNANSVDDILNNINSLYIKYQMLSISQVSIKYLANDLDVAISLMMKNKVLKKHAKKIVTSLYELVKHLYLYDVPTQYAILYKYIIAKDIDNFYKEFKKIVKQQIS